MDGSGRGGGLPIQGLLSNIVDTLQHTRAHANHPAKLEREVRVIREWALPGAAFHRDNG